MDMATGFEVSDRTFVSVFFLEMRIHNATDADSCTAPIRRDVVNASA